MRNQPATGYILYQKTYQENRGIHTLFSEAFGLVQGVGKKNLPLFLPLALLISGKKSLKTFSEVQLQPANPHQPMTHQALQGQGLFAGFYLNELLVKLLPAEEPLPTLWQHYQATLVALNQLYAPPSTNPFAISQFIHQQFGLIVTDRDKQNTDTLRLLGLKLLLRHFEHRLLVELGYGIDLTQAATGQPLTADQAYYYRWQEGWHIAQPNEAGVLGSRLEQWRGWLEASAHDENGVSMMFMTPMTLTAEELNQLLHGISPIYRLSLDELLEHQPLNSRKLWRQLVAQG